MNDTQDQRVRIHCTVFFLDIDTTTKPIVQLFPDTWKIEFRQGDPRSTIHISIPREEYVALAITYPSVWMDHVRPVLKCWAGGIVLLLGDEYTDLGDRA